MYSFWTNITGASGSGKRYSELRLPESQIVKSREKKQNSVKFEVNLVVEMSEEKSYETWCDEILIALQNGKPMPKDIKVIDCESLGLISR